MAKLLLLGAMYCFGGFATFVLFTGLCGGFLNKVDVEAAKRIIIGATVFWPIALPFLIILVILKVSRYLFSTLYFTFKTVMGGENRIKEPDTETDINSTKGN